MKAEVEQDCCATELASEEAATLGRIEEDVVFHSPWESSTTSPRVLCWGTDLSSSVLSPPQPQPRTRRPHPLEPWTARSPATSPTSPLSAPPSVLYPLSISRSLLCFLQPPDQQMRWPLLLKSCTRGLRAQILPYRRSAHARCRQRRLDML